MKNSKIVAITGSNGYLGKNTIKKAVHLGWNVHGIVRREEVVAEVEELGAKAYLIRKFDKESYKEAFEDCTAVFHFANVVCGSKDLFEKVNIEGLKQVIEAAKAAGVKRIIYPSGLGVDRYGKEKWAKNNYFWSKNEAEQLLTNSSINYRIFRPSYILGPGDELIPEILEQIIDGRVLIAGNGDVPMQPIFVEDAATAFLNAAEGVGTDNMIYSLVGPRIVTMNELVSLIIATIKDIGLSVPEPAIKYLSYEEAPEILGICADMVDVMRCDIIEDGFKTAKLLNFELSPLNKAVKAAVAKKLIHENNNTEKRAIILLSGGIDSTTALYWAKNQAYKIIALSINYKWRPKREIEAVKMFAEMLNIPLIEVPAPYIEDAVDLRMEGYPVPSATHAPQGYIPMRNLVFYSIAAYYAVIYDCRYIIGGHLKEDLEIFSDTSASFFQGLENLINTSKHSHDKSKIEFIFPLYKKTKIEVIKLAKKLEVPIDLTWSCYGDYKIPCGRCIPCLNRKKALDSYM
jgi:7-cyano-7-deazaguanine synthase